VENLKVQYLHFDAAPARKNYVASCGTGSAILVYICRKFFSVHEDMKL
jgi:hypothetical protein